MKSTVSFGKAIEHLLFSKMMLDGLDVYEPLADDHGVDALVKCPDGRFCEIQIKALSKDIVGAQTPVFANIRHPKSAIPNYWFIFYSGLNGRLWLLSSQDFINECSRNTDPKSAHINTCNLFLGKNREKYLISDFSRIINNQWVLP